MSNLTSKRKIIHIDMDAFFASVEQRDFPQLKGKPVIVGGPPNSRGVVATASYEARRFGVHSAMPSSQAYRLCPRAVFVPPRFEVYHEVSETVMEILSSYSELVEPVSLDEAYLDVSHHERYAREIAREIKERIEAATRLTASAGVGPNKFIAKVASDYHKPDGLTVVPPERVQAFLADLSVRKIPGVGPATEERLNSAGIYVIKDLQAKGGDELIELFGASGAWLHDISWGRDDREVEPERLRKSMGVEETYPRDLTNLEEMKTELSWLARRLATDLQEHRIGGKTVTLKVTYSDFVKITRRATVERFVGDAETIENMAAALLLRTDVTIKPVRLLGISMSGFPDESITTLPEQLCFPFMKLFQTKKR